MKVNDIINLLEHSAGRFITFSKAQRIELEFHDIYPVVRSAGLWLHENSFDNKTTLGILARNSFEWVVADLACIWCGIKLFPLQKGEDVGLYLDTPLEFSAVLLDEDYTDHQAAIEEYGIRCIYLQELTHQSISGANEIPPYKYSDKEIFAYKSTSGSTGAPKVLGQSVYSVENSIRGVQELFKHTEEDSLLVYLPLNLLQQRFWIYSAIIYQFTVIVVPSHYIFSAIRQEKPTVIMGVPYIFELIRDEFVRSISSDPDLSLKEYLGGNIKYLWTGSAPIAVDILEFYFTSGIPLYQGYGMNETCIATKCFPGSNKIGSVGKPFPNIQVRLDNEGQVLVRSKYPVCEHYTVGIEEDKQTFRPDGYIATGDIGYLDKDGYLFIKGRIKEMIALSNSKKIYPSDIETTLRSHHEIDHCILYGNGHPYLVALIIPSSKNVVEETIKNIINNYNNSAKQECQIYRFFLRFDDLAGAITNQNKVLRSKVHQQYSGEFEKMYE